MSRIFTYYIPLEGIRVIVPNAQKIIMNNVEGMSITFRPFPSPKPIQILRGYSYRPVFHLSYPQLNQ